MSKLLKMSLCPLALVVICTATMIFVVYAIPETANYTYKYGLWYDSWGYIRNRATGVNGFIPNLAYEVLGKWQGIAFEWGVQFAEQYSDKIQLAEVILRFVQQRTEYGFDEDNVVMDGQDQAEWAWNGDEMASRIDFLSNSPAIGDCEDLAFLCSAIYEGAGFDTAMVLTTDHAALLIWLPEYPNVLKWDLEGDGREYGWIWVESTGENNPLGWTPDAYRDGYWTAYIVEFLYIHNIRFSPKEPSIDDDVTVTTTILHRVSNLDKITLRYSLEENTYERSLEQADTMNYEAIIPKQQDGAIVEFEIVATDQNGYVRKSDLFTYQVGKARFKIPTFLTNAGLITVIFFVMVILFIVL